MCKQNFPLHRLNSRNCRCALYLDPTFSTDHNAMVARWSYSQGRGLAIHRLQVQILAGHHCIVAFGKLLKGILHSLTLRNEISSTHRSCYFLQHVKDL